MPYSHSHSYYYTPTSPWRRTVDVSGCWLRFPDRTQCDWVLTVTSYCLMLGQCFEPGTTAFFHTGYRGSLRLGDTNRARHCRRPATSLQRHSSATAYDSYRLELTEKLRWSNGILKFSSYRQKTMHLFFQRCECSLAPGSVRFLAKATKVPYLNLWFRCSDNSANTNKCTILLERFNDPLLWLLWHFPVMLYSLRCQWQWLNHKPKHVVVT
jgi:hypothetical protein